jgi:hypothetical protein
MKEVHMNLSGGTKLILCLDVSRAVGHSSPQALTFWMVLAV